MRLGSLSVLLCVLIASGLCFTAAAYAFAEYEGIYGPPAGGDGPVGDLVAGNA